MPVETQIITVIGQSTLNPIGPMVLSRTGTLAISYRFVAGLLYIAVVGLAFLLAVLLAGMLPHTCREAVVQRLRSKYFTMFFTGLGAWVYFQGWPPQDFQATLLYNFYQLTDAGFFTRFYHVMKMILSYITDYIQMSPFTFILFIVLSFSISHLAINIGRIIVAKTSPQNKNPLQCENTSIPITITLPRLPYIGEIYITTNANIAGIPFAILFFGGLVLISG